MNTQSNTTNQDKKNTASIQLQKEELPDYLATLSVDARSVWLKTLRAHLESGDFKRILLRLKGRGIDVKFHSINNVMFGKSYNPEFGPDVVKEALALIEERKKARSAAIRNSSAFFAQLVA